MMDKRASKKDEPMTEDKDMDQRVTDWDERVSIPVILNKRKNIGIESGWNQVAKSLARYNPVLDKDMMSDQMARELGIEVKCPTNCIRGNFPSKTRKEEGSG